MTSFTRAWLMATGAMFVALSVDMGRFEMDWWTMLGLKVILMGIGMIFFRIALAGLTAK